MHWNTNGARLVGDRARDRLTDPPGRIGRKLVAAAVFELVHRLHQADVAFLDQVEELQSAVGVLLGDRNHQAQVGLGHLSLGPARLGLAGGHLPVDFLQVLDRYADALLQIDQRLLLFQDGRRKTGQHLAVGFASGDFAADPVEIFLVAREGLDEIGARHAGFLHAQLRDRALVRAHFIHQPAQAIAQRLNLLRGKADQHQFAGNLLLRFQIWTTARAVLRQCLHHLVIEHTDLGEAFTGIGLELEHAGVLHRGAVFVLFGFGLQILFQLLVADFLGQRLRGRVRVDQAVNHFVDAHFFAIDPVGQVEDLGDRGRAGRNGLDHVLQAVLNALGDLDFALACQQFNRAHLAHIHAHGIGGPAEFRIDGGKRLLRLLDDVFIGNHRGRGLVHQQRFGIRRLVIDLDAHVVDHADDVLDLLGVEHVVREMVVDLRVSEIAALLAQDDQVFQAHSPCFSIDGLLSLHLLLDLVFASFSCHVS